MNKLSHIRYFDPADLPPVFEIEIVGLSFLKGALDRAEAEEISFGPPADDREDDPAIEVPA